MVGDLMARFLAEEGFATRPDEARARAVPFLAERANAVFLAFSDERAVGIATITTSFGFESGRYAELEDLYVEPAYRRRRIGVALVEAVTSWAAERECEVLEVVIAGPADSQPRRAEWWLRRGWVDDGRRLLGRRLSPNASRRTSEMPME